MLVVDRARLRTVAGLRDGTDVLSVYVTADPRQESAGSPAWQVQIRNELNALLHRLRDTGDGRRLAALQNRLTELEPVLDDLLDAASGGRGRALFAALGRPEVYALAMQRPLVNRVVLDPAAYLHPLVAAYGTGAPAGVITVGAHGVRAVDYRFGLAHELLNLPYEQPAADEGEPGEHAMSPRDLYARRGHDHLTRFLAGTGPQLAALADQAGWEDLVVTGDDELVAALSGGLPSALDARVLTTSHVAPAALTPAQVAALVATELADARHSRGRLLAEQARDAALAGGPGAYGLADTLTALAEGRVAHLLLDASGRWSGSRAPDGRLVPEGEIPPGTAPADLVAEPDLAERMLEEAFRHGGEATLLDPAPAALTEAGGVAALLRW